MYFAFTGVLWPLPVPSVGDVWVPGNARVLDTAQIADSPTAYLFWYDAGALGYTIRMVSLGKPSHEHALIQSDYMNGIRWTAPDTLVVDLWKNEFRILKDRSGVVVVPHVSPQ